MELTPSQVKVLEAITCLRAESGCKSLKGTDVASHSGVSRQNWSAKTATAEWKAIKRCIQGSLLTTHPLEVIIRSHHESGKFRFATRIVELERLLAAKTQDEEAIAKNFNEFKQRIFEDQYKDAHMRVNFEKHKKRLKTLEENTAKDKLLINSYQAEISNLASDYKKLLQKINIKGSASILPLTRIYEPCPDIEKEEMKRQDIFIAYTTAIQACLKNITEDILTDKVSDIFMIFHKFDYDIDTLVKKQLPYKLPGMCFIFACYAPTGRTRALIYSQLKDLLGHSPTVVLAEAKEEKSPTDINSKKNSRYPKVLIDFSRASNFSAYDIISEGYESVIVVR